MSLDNREAGQVQEIHRDVVVVGAGWSGLLTCRYMLEEGLSVVALERREDIGGVWRYSDDTSIPTVMKSTQTTSSSTVTEISDYPMPKEIGMFPHHTDILEYLHGFVRDFKLLPYLRFNCAVEKVEKEGEVWRVSCSTGDVYTSKYLVIAAGQYQVPDRTVKETTLQGFTGKVLHAIEVKQPLDEFKDSRLLLFGGGETGSDICFEWFEHAKYIYWSIPRGQHFFRKYAKVVPWGTPQALDKASSRMMKRIAPFHRSKPGLAWVCKWTTSGSLLAYQGHGIPEWRNKADYFKFFINKNGKVLDLIDYERLVPKGGIIKCDGKEVTFVDGTKQEFDLVIMSTGYATTNPYLPEQYRVGVRERHKMVFDVHDPTLAFVGLVRPIVGSIVGISEVQARWASKIFAGKIPLKSFKERKEDVETDRAYWNEYFKHSSQRIQGLVEGFSYIDDIAKHAKIYPDYCSLFLKSPRKWFVAYFSPFNPATYRLNEPDKLDKSIATMRSHQKGTVGPLQYLHLMFLRFIWFDWWLDRISDLKYRIQTSSWWPTIRSWRVTRWLDYLWTIPKRAIFDDVSDDVDELSPKAKLLMRSSKHACKHPATGGSIPLANTAGCHSNGMKSTRHRGIHSTKEE